jgi:hypothetical protein
VLRTPQASSLPPSLQHVWLSDCLLQEPQQLPQQLPGLRTLVIKRSPGAVDLLSDALLNGLSSLRVRQCL